MASTQSFQNAAPLWFNTGVWGQMGYAAPNTMGYNTTLNAEIADLVSLVGLNLFGIMGLPDANQRVPPSVNTLCKVSKLIVRVRGILAGRAVPPGTLRMEANQSGPQTFLLYPCPYFLVRNPYLKKWAGLIFSALTAMAVHTENSQPMDISTAFAGQIGQYFQRIYVRMATELLNVDQATALAPGYTIPASVFQAYDPSALVTSVEMIDSGAAITSIPSALDLRVLEEGIQANQIVGLIPWPTPPVASPQTVAMAAEVAALTPNPAPAAVTMTAPAAATTATTPAPTGAAFIPPPGP